MRPLTIGPPDPVLGRVRLGMRHRPVPTRTEVAALLREVRARWTGIPFDPVDEALEERVDDVLSRLP